MNKFSLVTSIMLAHSVKLINQFGQAYNALVTKRLLISNSFIAKRDNVVTKKKNMNIDELVNDS